MTYCAIYIFRKLLIDKSAYTKISRRATGVCALSHRYENFERRRKEGTPDVIFEAIAALKVSSSLSVH
jgi:hypothetical protein